MASSLQRVSPPVYIYIKNVCLFVMHSVPVIATITKTFHDAYLGPKERRRVVKISNQGGGGGWVRFHPDDDILRLFGPCDS
jgi:hypothetical protein